jgi:hypothetical protein
MTTIRRHVDSGASFGAAAAGFALCAVACVANAGVAAPRVIGFDTAGSQSETFSLPATALQVPVTQLRLRFDQPMSLDADLPGPDGVDLPANYRLLGAGTDNVFATASCAASPLGDDTVIAISGATWSASLNEIALRLDTDTGMPRGRYRLLACSQLASTLGLQLDGDGDGIPGGDALRDFAVDLTPRLENPGFDLDASGWTAHVLSQGTATVERVALDADGAFSSGALRIASSSATSVLLGSDSCVIVPPGNFIDASTRVQLHYRVVTGNVRVIANVHIGFGGDLPGDTGCVGPGVTVADPAFAGIPGDFIRFDSGEIETFYAPLAEFSLRVVSLDGGPFEVLLDDIGLSFDRLAIFSADFE